MRHLVVFLLYNEVKVRCTLEESTTGPFKCKVQNVPTEMFLNQLKLWFVTLLTVSSCKRHYILTFKCDTLYFKNGLTQTRVIFI